MKLYNGEFFKNNEMKPFTKIEHGGTFEKVKGINKKGSYVEILNEYNKVGRIEYGDYFI
jgi:hypothetical protein